MKFTYTLLLCFLALCLSACGGGSSANTPAPNYPQTPSPPPVVDETEAPEQTEVPGETVMPDESEVPEEENAPDETEASEEVEAPEVPEETEVPDESEVPEETEAPEEVEAPEESGVPEETEVPEESGVLEETEVPEESGVPEESEIPEEVESPEEPEIPEETSKDWLVLIEEDPTAKSHGRLQEIYDGAVDTRYHGSTEFADITPEAAQAYFKILKGDPVYPIYNLGYTRDDFALKTWETLYDFERSQACRLSGLIDLIARASGNQAIVAVQYQNCLKEQYSWGHINGSGALYLEDRSNGVWLADRYNFTQFYNSISTSYDGQSMEVTGYFNQAFKAPESADIGFNGKEVFLFTYPSTGKQFVKYVTFEYVSLPDDKHWINAGFLMIDTLGKVNYTSNRLHESLLEPYRTTIFSGRNNAQARLNYLSGAVELLLDSDGDGFFEAGQYFQDDFYFFHNDFSENPVVPVAEMNRPPRVLTPYVYLQYFDEDPVSFNLSYRDFDTPEENLQITAYWEINGVPLIDFHERVLPADRTSVGDKVSFYFEVFDGTHRVRSGRVNVLIYGPFE